MCPARANSSTCTYPDGSTPRVCIVGAGLSGVCAAIQLKRQLGHTNFVMFEKAHDVGGVWLANKYPGCQVDLPIVLYSFSFAQNPGWSKICPDRDEMWAYVKDTATKYDIYRYACFGTTVDSIRWSDNSKTWIVTTTDVKTKEESVHEFNVVILGTGPLSTPNFPPVFETFSGPKMHSAEWDSNIKLENQVVGVVGTGSSGVQIIPEIAPKVKKLIVYLREPNYVYPKLQISIWWITKFVCTLLPWIVWFIRTLGFLVIDLLLARLYYVGSFMNRSGRFIANSQIRSNVKDKQLQKLLTPRYAPGYKIPAVAYDAYYKSYNRPNVQLNQSPVSKVKGQDITTEDGRVDRLDVLILCTGFKPLDLGSLRITGAGGIDILQMWKLDRPKTFYGVTCAEAPNLFFLQGPNGASGYGSALFMIECQVTFVVSALRQLMKRDAASIRVRPSAQAESMEEIRVGEQKRVYMQAGPPGVTSTWLLNERGHGMIWPKSSTCYWLRTRRLDSSKFEFTSRTDKKMKMLNSEKYQPLSIEDVV